MKKINNMRVRNKILFAFAIVVLLMAAAIVFVAVSNINTMNNVDVILENTGFQAELNDILKEFNDADVQANILYQILDDDANEAYKVHAAAVEKNFQIVLKHIDSFEIYERFRPILTQAYNEFNEWNSAVNELIIKNNELDAGRDTFSASGSQLVTSLGLFMDTIADENLSTEQLKLALEISDAITAFRLSSRTFQYSFDTAYIAQIIDKMDETIALLERFKRGSNSLEHTKVAQDLIGTISKRYAYTDDFSAANDAADVAMEIALPLGVKATTEIYEAIEDVQKAVAERVVSTKNSSVTSLIIIIAAMILVLICALIIAFTLARMINTPLAKMQVIMEQAGKTGNLNFSDEVKKDILGEAEKKDEIGQSLAAFALLIDHMTYIGECLTKISNNDLSLNINLSSSEDTMGNALNTLLNNMNTAFDNIKEASEQVNTGSLQVSDSSIALSQGATEQASSIEQLSASLEEIAGQTEQNSKYAEEANSFALSAKSDAQQGDKHMQEMLVSITEINEGSANIAKIIKVIDDIAFQTNILALNAAVEAARAGAAGKGFAVVAEEVGSLAARSANAAKEITEMIEDSIKKTENGTHIAHNTAEALKKIVDGVDHVAELVGNITAASNEQSMGIGQVNQAVLQVSQVVQTNAATSEESAAASEEMSGQAGVLREMIAQFNLRNSGYTDNIVVDKIKLPKAKKQDVSMLTLDGNFGKY